MNNHYPADPSHGGPEMQRTLTDAVYAELMEQVAGRKVVGVALWEESLADEETGAVSPEARDIVDLDLYLEENLYFELYGVQIFPDLDSDPLRGLAQIGKIMSRLASKGVWLDEIAATEEDELVLILSRHHEPQMYLVVAGWLLDQWETLPSEA